LAVALQPGSRQRPADKAIHNENLILASLGGMAGLILGRVVSWLFDVSTFPRSGIHPASTSTALFFALCITVLTGLLVALAPSAAFFELDLIARMKTRFGKKLDGVGICLLVCCLVSEIRWLFAIRWGRLAAAKLPAAERLDPGFLPDHLLAHICEQRLRAGPTLSSLSGRADI